MKQMTTGYSGTPLIKKLGIKESARVAIIGAPDDFSNELGPLPANAEIVKSITKNFDLILLFAKSETRLIKDFERLCKKLKPDGRFWVAWPKKSSGVATDLSFDVAQRIGLAAGLIDTKICAINEIWSGLCFVVRLKDRSRQG